MDLGFMLVSLVVSWQRQWRGLTYPHLQDQRNRCLVVNLNRPRGLYVPPNPLILHPIIILRAAVHRCLLRLQHLGLIKSSLLGRSLVIMHLHRLQPLIHKTLWGWI